MPGKCDQMRGYKTSCAILIGNDLEGGLCKLRGQNSGPKRKTHLVLKYKFILPENISQISKTYKQSICQTMKQKYTKQFSCHAWKQASTGPLYKIIWKGYTFTWASADHKK